jgi:branched-chain amino acid transport system substrate-binding protein
MLGITHYDAAGLWGAHSISFATADRGKGTAGADNCEWCTKWDGKSFDLVAHADPICGETVPGKTVSTGS